MASKSMYGPMAANAVAKFFEGFMQGKFKKKELEEIVADRAIKQRQMQIMEAEEARKGKPKGLYSEEAGKWLSVPPEYGDVEVIKRPISYTPYNWETGQPGSPLPPGQRPFNKPTTGDWLGALLSGGTPTPKPKPAPSGPKIIRVKLKASGATGSIPENEFDPNLYERL